MPLSDVIGMFGSDKPPTAVANRFAAPIMNSGRRLAVNTLNAIRPDIANAYGTYMAGQGKQEELAGDQEGVIRQLLSKALGSDPTQLLKNVGSTLFGFIDPNVVNPLARFDVNSNILANRARGINPAALDSTAERLRNARVASGRYYDVARQVYGALPGTFNQVYGAGVADDERARGYIPQISAAYEAVSGRPMQAILNRIAAARAGQGVEAQGIQDQLAGTQGYKQHQNFADKLSKTLAADEKAAMDIANMALSFYTGGLAGGGGGSGSGGGGGGGGGGFQPNINYGGAGYSPAFYERGPQ